MAASNTILHPEIADQKTREQIRRAERGDARAMLWQHSKLNRVRRCGRVKIAGAVSVVVTEDADGQRTAGYSGLEHCGSIWACPTCSAQVHHRRELLIAEALHRWDRYGGKVALVTLTVRHHAGNGLQELFDTVTQAWKAACGVRKWQETQAEFGTEMQVGKWKSRRRIPIIRVIEITWGEHGWHVHVHALLLLPDGVTQADVETIGAGMWQRWNDKAVKLGLRSGLEWVRDATTGELKRVGWQAELVKGDPSAALGKYFSKAVYELTGSRFKEAAHGNLTPMGILARLQAHRSGMTCVNPAEDGSGCECARLTEAEYRRLWRVWREYEQVTHGRQAYAFPPGVMQLLGLGPEWMPDDQEIVDEALGGEAVCTLPDSTWSRIVHHNLLTQVLESFERSYQIGIEFLRFIDQMVPEFEVPKPPEVEIPPIPKRRDAQGAALARELRQYYWSHARPEPPPPTTDTLF